MCPFVKDRFHLFDTFLNDRLSHSNPGNVFSVIGVIGLLLANRMISGQLCTRPLYESAS